MSRCREVLVATQTPVQRLREQARRRLDPGYVVRLGEAVRLQVDSNLAVARMYRAHDLRVSTGLGNIAEDSDDW